MVDRVIVVGGGPAGLMAAGRAAELGAEVLLIEKTPRLGNKLRLSGGGHGNISHAGNARSIADHLGPGGACLSEALARFGPDDLMTFFQERGVPTVTDKGGRIWPATHNAHTVLSALKAWCLEHRVTFRYRSPILDLLTSTGCGAPLARDVPVVTGVRCAEHDIAASAVVLATGGMSYPATGSSGDGYGLAQRAGHTLVSPVPGLVPLVLSTGWVSSLSGLSLVDVGLTAYRGPEAIGHRLGDVVFTGDGLSGPAALNLSNDVSRALALGPLRLQIDLLPGTPPQALDSELARAFQASGRTGLARVLRQWVPAVLVAPVLAAAEVDAGSPVAELSAARRRRIGQTIKGLELHLVGTRPIQEAMVTLGGIPAEEIDPMTMASRRVGGLYMAGEVIDVGGDTGGYNLHAAFASGRLAGESAASH